MSNKLGFIGCGKMAKAIIKGILNANYLTEKDIIASEISEEFAQKAQKALNIQVISDNKKVIEFADTIFIATKPNQVENVLNEIKDYINGKLIVSIAAGVNTKKIEAITQSAPVIRVMPNTPALVGEAMSAMCANDYVSEEKLEVVLNIFKSFCAKGGKV